MWNCQWVQTHAGDGPLKSALTSVLGVALEPGCVSAFKPALCSPPAANQAADAAWLCLCTLESLPLWKDWASDKTWVRRGRKRQKISSTNFQRKIFPFPFGEWCRNRSGSKVPRILIMLSSHFLSFQSCCFTIHRAFQLAFFIWFSTTSCRLVYTQ